ncbi:pantetheine-phosphate adenylyltransferase [Fulvivirga sedimenti]|jgi:pantetheine-phosphate adenylyltransferase|uniref:Phosphopantetheine adenylyltransferase n=1 Tax=Fulvivirga sedimenti TaxID=2879465 RepID=A0A9X1KWE3_9BACT|nr:pantetheine-phosphate adenylyltransferase [Fulvivirga sedimenti]MCA6073894.1 pantetheine-phosphate adenylyltransferase [Fulvivirga sedimenti]
MKKRIAIFPGSFDPFTKGHEDIVLRGLEMFDEIIIAIGHNSKKNLRYFAVDKMTRYIEKAFDGNQRVRVMVYNELTADLAKRYDARFLLRGLRNTTDFEYENSISQVNRHLNKDLESVFLITSPQYAAISSTIIREVHRYGGDISEYLPYSID